MDNSSFERSLLRGECVAAAGLLTEETTNLQTMIIYGRLMDDPVVSARCEALGFEVDPDTGLETAALKFDIGDVVEIIKAMTHAEKVALRERVAGH